MPCALLADGLRRLTGTPPHPGAHLQTLSDSDRRATYDAISGFSGNSVNPFLDDAFARDQVGRAARVAIARVGPQRAGARGQGV